MGGTTATAITRAIDIVSTASHPTSIIRRMS
jgi:hypothetical protein